MSVVSEVVRRSGDRLVRSAGRGGSRRRWCERRDDRDRRWPCDDWWGDDDDDDDRRGRRRRWCERRDGRDRRWPCDDWWDDDDDDDDDRYCSLTGRRKCRRPRWRASRQQVEIVQADVSELLDSLRNSEVSLEASAQELFGLLDELRYALRWETHLQPALVGLVIGVIEQAERFGQGKGALKREFAVDLVIRSLQIYHFGGAPFPKLVEEALEPFVGMMVDWAVAILNIHDAWPAGEPPRVPKVFVSRPFKRLVSIVGWIWRGFSRLVRWLTRPSYYERQLHRAMRQLEPQTKELYEAMPPDRLLPLVDELIRIVNRLGALTAPHIDTLEVLVRLSGELVLAEGESRLDLLVAAAQQFLLDVYAKQPLARRLLQSELGVMVLRELILVIGNMLERMGLTSFIEPNPA